MLMLGSQVPNLLKTGFGAFQAIKGNKLSKELDRPFFDIPESAMEALSRSKQLASETLMPGQGYYETQIDKSASRSFAGAREGASNPAQLMEAALKIGENTNDSVLSMAIKGMERKDSNSRDLIKDLGTMSKWEQMQFNTNEMQPFLDDASLASSMQGAGLQNIFGGLDGMGAGLSAMLGEEDMAAMLERLRSGTGKKKPTMTEALNTDVLPDVVPIPNYDTYA
jgi:hypothetical protein